MRRTPSVDQFFVAELKRGGVILGFTGGILFVYFDDSTFTFTLLWKLLYLLDRRTRAVVI